MIPKNLILGPIDNKALTGLGIIIYMFKYDLFQIDNIIAVDSGAILALLLAARIDPLLILINLLEFEPYTNIDQNINLFQNHGFFNDAYLHKFLNNILRQHYRYVPTLHELYRLTNIDLTFVTYNLSKGQVETLNYKTHPDISCVTACILSYVRPIIFAKIKYNNMLYIGGIIGNPHPTDLIENEEDTLVIYGSKSHHGGDNIFDYIDILLDTPINQLREKNENGMGENIYHIKIISNNMDYILHTNLNKSEKFKIINQNYEVAKSFFQSFQKSEIKETPLAFDLESVEKEKILNISDKQEDEVILNDQVESNLYNENELNPLLISEINPLVKSEAGSFSL